MSPCLVFNVGSSSLKWTVLTTDDQVIAEGNEPLNSTSDKKLNAIVESVLARAPGAAAIGHRIVHGGTSFQQSTRVADSVRSKLKELTPLDPLHMQPALAVLDAALRIAPDVPHVAAFDTAFHRTLSDAASGYGLPHDWSERWDLRRFGFHGLSVEWSVHRTTDYRGELPPRMIVAHLGSGCSITAVRNGRSIDTTMGLTPLDGLMMSTRCGSLDPGLLLYLQTHCGLDVATLQKVLSQESGLLGVSGLSGDIREILAARARGHALATLAYERFVFYARRAFGAMLGSLGGLDVLVFTGGIGEHSSLVREDLAQALGSRLLDPRQNALPSINDGAVGLDAEEIGAGKIEVLVVRAREDLIIARDVRRLAGVARN